MTPEEQPEYIFIGFKCAKCLHFIHIDNLPREGKAPICPKCDNGYMTPVNERW